MASGSYPIMPCCDCSGHSCSAVTWPRKQEMAPPLKPLESLNFHFLCSQRRESFVAELVMVTARPKHASAWSRPEILDLIGLWDEKSIMAQLRASKENLDIYGKKSQSMLEKGHNKDAQQCRVKIKELWQAYQKAREVNSHSGSSPKTCRFCEELLAILGGDSTIVLPHSIDSSAGSQSREDDTDCVDEEEDVESRLQESGLSILPHSQDLFLTPEQSSNTQDSNNDPGEGISDTLALPLTPCRKTIADQKEGEKT
ncbi:zinc finger and SCAN domain-containing protein 20-like [Emydura macquarii macquarii]|uniref:zinc finger and SCAN domain-containing protein 20-like n=1 Tax=Emydura macquarii macquarii TaxID=1129001 RepID=UPI00352AF221